jgi:hypothetical protein
MEIVDICERIALLITLCKERGSRLRSFQTCAATSSLSSSLYWAPVAAVAVSTVKHALRRSSID